MADALESMQSSLWNALSFSGPIYIYTYIHADQVLTFVRSVNDRQIHYYIWLNIWIYLNRFSTNFSASEKQFEKRQINVQTNI